MLWLRVLNLWSLQDSNYRQCNGQISAERVVDCSNICGPRSMFLERDIQRLMFALKIHVWYELSGSIQRNWMCKALINVVYWVSSELLVPWHTLRKSEQHFAPLAWPALPSPCSTLFLLLRDLSHDFFSIYITYPPSKHQGRKLCW